MMEPLAVTVKEACRLSGLCKSTIYLLIKEGKLTLIKVGRRSLISYSAIAELLKVEEEKAKTLTVKEAFRTIRNEMTRRVLFGETDEEKMKEVVGVLGFLEDELRGATRQ